MERKRAIIGRLEVVRFMMECLDCGNCRQGMMAYYCAVRNEFVIRKTELVVEREEWERGWKRGNPHYESQCCHGSRRCRIRDGEIR